MLKKFFQLLGHRNTILSQTSNTILAPWILLLSDIFSFFQPSTNLEFKVIFFQDKQRWLLTQRPHGPCVAPLSLLSSISL